MKKLYDSSSVEYKFNPTERYVMAEIFADTVFTWLNAAVFIALFAKLMR